MKELLSLTLRQCRFSWWKKHRKDSDSEQRHKQHSPAPPYKYPPDYKSIVHQPPSNTRPQHRPHLQLDSHSHQSNQRQRTQQQPHIPQSTHTHSNIQQQQRHSLPPLYRQQQPQTQPQPQV